MGEGKCRAFLVFVLLLGLWPARSNAVNPETLLMPGKLTNAHAKYEEQCSLCHDRSDRKRQTRLCLDCHKDIAADVAAKRGFHGHLAGITTSECRGCHSEHLGRGADIVKLSRSQFDHDGTDFPLRDAHASVACASCHVAGKPYRCSRRFSPQPFPVPLLQPPARTGLRSSRLEAALRALPVELRYPALLCVCE